MFLIHCCLLFSPNKKPSFWQTWCLQSRRGPSRPFGWAISLQIFLDAKKAIVLINCLLPGEQVSVFWGNFVLAKKTAEPIFLVHVCVMFDSLFKVLGGQLAKKIFWDEQLPVFFLAKKLLLINCCLQSCWAPSKPPSIYGPSERSFWDTVAFRLAVCPASFLFDKLLPSNFWGQVNILLRNNCLQFFCWCLCI